MALHLVDKEDDWAIKDSDSTSKDSEWTIKEEDSADDYDDRGLERAIEDWTRAEFSQDLRARTTRLLLLLLMILSRQYP